MKKRLFKSVSIFAIAIMAGVNVFKAQQPVQLSDIAMANVEALATGESAVGGQCNNINGYRSWYVEKNPNVPADADRNQLRGFQDCCFQDKEGYLPTGDCKAG